MKLIEAINKAKNTKNYVKLSKNGCWTEYYVQYFWRGDILSWTAGNTCGGAVGRSKLESASDNWFVFTRFGDDTSIVSDLP